MGIYAGIVFIQLMADWIQHVCKKYYCIQYHLEAVHTKLTFRSSSTMLKLIQSMRNHYHVSHTDMSNVGGYDYKISGNCSMK